MADSLKINKVMIRNLQMEDYEQLSQSFTRVYNDGSDVFALAVDDDDYMWLVAGGTGDVWRGRLNRLGWEDWQTSFTE